MIKATVRTQAEFDSAVEASSDEDPVRSVWIRDAQDDDVWVTVTTLGYVMRAYTRDLIDPSPVLEEER